MNEAKEAEIVVVGSFMVDLMSKSPKLPAPGQTILGGPFFMGPGGKGANQAVAAAKLGAKVEMVVSLGTDSFGDLAYESLAAQKVGVDFVKRVEDAPTGVALIIVDDNTGENMIVVAPGANELLTEEDVAEASTKISEADCVVMQLEIPLKTVEYTAKLAYEAGVPVILDPAPARQLPADLFPRLALITPNETEAALISGIEVTDLKSAEKAANVLLAKGPQAVALTLGRQGVLLANEEKMVHIPAFAVATIDTTGAGDAFNGALAVALAEGKGLA
ncbi:MAG TPA: ribokinase, partial [Firmicutes bacterium]|nr:ribokinase [Bacillota bacterium]